MKKEKIEIKDLYQLGKEDLKECADTAAKAFIDDPACKFLFKTHLNYKALYAYFLVIFKAIYDKTYIFSDNEKVNGFIIISPIKNAKLSLYDFLKAGGYRIILTQGFGIILRSLKYEKNCKKIREKIVTANDWYIFQFGVSPTKQGNGLGSSIIKPILNWFESQHISCYLETHKEVNVNIYNHLGFALKSKDTLPNVPTAQYAMLIS